MSIAPLPAGTLLGGDPTHGPRYRVLGVMGQGGFGITYRCHDAKLGVDVVVKELAVSDLSGRDERTGGIAPVGTQRNVERLERLLRRFINEAQTLARIGMSTRTPYVVHVVDQWSERGTAYYAMSMVEAEGPWPIPETGEAMQPDALARWMARGRQLLEALAVVHEAGVACHGDLKPANVLIDRRGRPVLIDFGTVRNEEELARTVRTVLHTPGWAAPELQQANSLRAAGPWSDLYGWGMLMWGAACSHPTTAYDEDTGSEVPWPVDAMTRMMGSDPYASPEPLLAVGVPKVWADVVVQALALDPQQRPQSAGEILALVGEPSALAAPAGSASSPRRTGLGVLVVVALLGIVGGGLLSQGGWSRDRLDGSTRVGGGPSPEGSSEGSMEAQPIEAAVASCPEGFVAIAPGSFMMGSPLDEPGRGDDEVQHSVTLTRGFCMQATEVTQSSWSLVMGTSPSYFSDCGGDCPVEQVSWYDALAYANALSRSEGLEECYDLSSCRDVPARHQFDPEDRWSLAGDPVKGARDALVTIVEFGNFQCEYCSRVNPTIDEIMSNADFAGKVRVVFNQLPLTIHRDAYLAGQASLAAHAQGKFWAYHDLLFENQRALKRDDLERYAEQLGLNMAEFRAALDNATYSGQVDDEIALSRTLGMRGTPGFMVNGRNVQGAQPFAAFETIIREEITAMEALISGGRTLGEAYAARVETNLAAAGLSAQNPQASAASAIRQPDPYAEVFIPGSGAVSGGNVPYVGAGENTCASVRFTGLDCTGYRLPTEAEWEYAARAGTQTSTHAGTVEYIGDRCQRDGALTEIARTCATAAVAYSGGVDLSGRSGASNAGPSEVASLSANTWGLYDMLGNVWEWVWDGSSSYPSEEVTDPLGDESSDYRMIRGGGWLNSARGVRAAHRNRDSPGNRRSLVGFRLSRSLP